VSAASLVRAQTVGLGKLAALPHRGQLERLDGAGLVDVHDGVELLADTSGDVMAPALRFRLVDDADPPLETRCGQPQCCAREQRALLQPLRLVQ